MTRIPWKLQSLWAGLHPKYTQKYGSISFFPSLANALTSPKTDVGDDLRSIVCIGCIRCGWFERIVFFYENPMFMTESHIRILNRTLCEGEYCFPYLWTAMLKSEGNVKLTGLRIGTGHGPHTCILAEIRCWRRSWIWNKDREAVGLSFYVHIFIIIFFVGWTKAM